MKKGVKRIATIAFYSTITTLIVLVTFVLVTIGRGYFFDFKTGQISGGGLILLDSRPSGGAVSVDGKALKKDTPTRLGLKAGTYNISVIKNGYRTWRKNLEVITSEVTWAKYLFLLPDSIRTQELLGLSEPRLLSQSPDQKFLVIATGGPTPQLQVLESGQQQARVFYNLSPEQIAAGMQIDSITWAQDSQHILVGLRGATANSQLVLSVINPAEAFDLTKDFSLPLANLQFSGQNWRELYWPSPEGLRRLDLANRTVSAVLVTDVDGFLTTKEAVFVTQRTTQFTRLLRLESDGQLKVLIEQLPQSSYQLQSAAIDDKNYLVLLNKNSHTIELYHSTTQAGQYLQPLVGVSAQSITVGPDERYLVMQDGDKFASYDFEFARLHKFSLPAAPSSQVTWFDPYHLLAQVNSDIIMFEFDGGNIESITNSVEGFPAFSSRDRDFLYSVGRNQAGSLVLQTSELKR